MNYKLELWDKKTKEWISGENRPYSDGLKQTIGMPGIEITIKARLNFQNQPKPLRLSKLRIVK